MKNATARPTKPSIIRSVKCEITSERITALVAATSEIDGYQDYRGTYTNSFGASIGLQPGIVAFITNNAAVELSIGVLGIGFERQLQTKNQVEQGKTNSLDTNFKLNLLSVGFGMSFYL